MKRSLRTGLIVLAGALILLQFFRPGRNLGEPSGPDDLLVVSHIPDSLAMVLKTSCYDCHSNRTRYPWYSYVVPVNWFIEKHVREGKEALNFSTYGGSDKKQKIGILANICEQVESGGMPLQSFLVIHRDAGISPETAEALCNWTDMEALRLMRE
jgi:hypothetical protein